MKLAFSLDDLAKRYGLRTALRWHGAEGGAAYTYQSLIAASAAVAQELMTRGLAPGDRVALLCAPSPEWAVAMIAIRRAGGVLAPLDTNRDAEGLAKLIETIRPRLLLAAPDKMTEGSTVLSLARTSASLVDLDCAAVVKSMPTVRADDTAHDSVFALPASQPADLMKGLIEVLTVGGCARFCPALRPIDVLDAVRDKRTQQVFCTDGLSRLVEQASRNEASHWPALRKSIFRLAMAGVPGFMTNLRQRVFKKLQHGYRIPHWDHPASVAASPGLEFLRTKAAGLRKMLLVSLGCLLAAPATAARIVYVAEQDIAYVIELYLADLDRPEQSIKLNRGLSRFSNGVGAFAISPDGSQIAFAADQDVRGDTDLFIVDIAAPGKWTRIGDLPAGKQELWMEFSPDGNKLAFTASDMNYGNVELYVVDLTQPGKAVRMNGALAVNGSVSTTGFEFTPDGRNLVYVAGELESKYELYAVALDAPGQSVRLNAAGGSVGDTYEGRFRILPDSRRVVFSAVWQNSGHRELHIVSLDAPGQPATLNPAFTNAGYIWDFDLSPDGRQVAYLADPDTRGIYEVFLASTDSPGIAQKINDPVLNGAGLARFTGDGRYVVFLADGTRGADNRDLFMAPTDGSSGAIRVSAPVAAVEDVSRYALGGSQVAYPVVSASGYAEDLHVAHLDNPGSSIKVNGPLPGGTLELFPEPQFSPDGTEIAFIAVESVDSSIQQLYFARLSAPGASIRINPDLAQDGILGPYPHAFEFLPAGAPPTGNPASGSSTSSGNQGRSSGGGSMDWLVLLALVAGALRRRTMRWSQAISDPDNRCR